MNLPIRIPLLLLTLIFLLMNSAGSLSTKSFDRQARRIAFQIATVEERAGERNVISYAVVEGPAGTDFDIDLNGEGFKLRAEFLTDLQRDNQLLLRARLQTRRLYGLSKNARPLYEEDLQNQTLRLGFDEDVILLPFGGDGGDEKLKIEITPVMSDEPAYDASGKLRALEINLPKVGPGGMINLQARKIPHRFEAEVALLEDGVEVARSEAQLLLREKQEVSLEPLSQNRATLNNPLVIRLSVEDFRQSGLNQNAHINFDILQLRTDGVREPIGSNWSGIGAIGNSLNYNLGEVYPQGSGKKYELRFHLKIAKGEIVE
jgi:hypothetical protein